MNVMKIISEIPNTEEALETVPVGGVIIGVSEDGRVLVRQHHNAYPNRPFKTAWFIPGVNDLDIPSALMTMMGSVEGVERWITVVMEIRDEEDD